MVRLSGNLVVPAFMGGTEELLTTIINDIEGSASREKVLRPARVITDHARDRDGHVTSLDFSSSLIVRAQMYLRVAAQTPSNERAWVPSAHGSARVPGTGWYPSEILVHHAHQASGY